MDLARSAEYQMQLRHRHNDGTWSNLEPRPDHDPASHDPEQRWGNYTLYVCQACDEQVMVEKSDDAGRPPR